MSASIRFGIHIKVILQSEQNSGNSCEVVQCLLNMLKYASNFVAVRVELLKTCVNVQQALEENTVKAYMLMISSTCTCGILEKQQNW